MSAPNPTTNGNAMPALARPLSERVRGPSFLVETLLLAFLVGLLPADAVAQISTEPVGSAASEPVEYVIAISFDGLHSGAIPALDALQLPNFYRLLSEGASTLNARTDYDYTSTMPNHVSMITGRPVLGETGHQATDNNDPPTVHSQAGFYVASMFDVAHEAGLQTAMYASKSKFDMFDDSYPDAIGTFYYNASFDDMVDRFIADMQASPHHLSLIHIREPDSEGHTSGWNLSPGSAYLNEVKEGDFLLGLILGLVEGDERLRGKTTVIITSDHGGDGTGHSDETDADIYTIPFIVWGAGVDSGVDLYALNESTRTDPGTDRPEFGLVSQPVRSGDLGNLALDLLGLGDIPGSSINTDAAPLIVDQSAPGAPTARITADPTFGIAPLAVTFDGSSSSDSDGTIVSYAWNFGDGQLGSGAAINHTYSAPGQYTARLTVTDNEGKVDDAIVAVTVSSSDTPFTVRFQNGVAPNTAYSGTTDTKLKSDNQTTNFGAAAELEIDGSPDYGSLIKWDLSSIPAGSDVVEATITFHGVNGSRDSYHLYQALRDWSEAEATWLQYAAGDTWETAGARGTLDRGSVRLGGINAPGTGSVNFPLNEDGLELLETWIQNPASNFGFLIESYDGGGDGFDFASTEYASASARPVLAVTYFLPQEGVPTASINATPTSGDLPLLVEFNASGSTDDGTILSYAWDFGDGMSAVGVSTTHTYTDAGQYTVTLTVTDDEAKSGRASATISVTDPRSPVSITFQNGSAPSTAYLGAKDTSIKSDSPGSNFGNSASLEVDGSPDYGVLLHWDLSLIPPGADVTDASIVLSGFNGSSHTYSLYELLKTWEENAATWNSSSAGVAWESSGAQGSGDRIDTILGTITSPSSGSVTLMLNSDGLAVIERWLLEPGVNNGFILENYAGASDGFDFYSSESSTASRRPALHITYLPPADGAPLPDVNVPPVAFAGATPSSGLAPLAVTLDASASYDPDGTIVSYSWTSGDGAVLTGATVEHSYAVPGRYTATVTITDDDGATQTAPVDVVVDDPDQPVTVTFQDGVSPVATYSGTRDTKIRSDAQSTSYGAATGLEVDGSPDYGALLRWDLSSIPAGSEIVGASISLHGTNGSRDSFFLFEVFRKWSEGASTWLSYATGQPWETPGARGSIDRGGTVLGSLHAPGAVPVTIALNESALETISRWINDPGSNNGFILENYDGAGDGFDFYSREYVSALRRPSLTVTYRAPDPGAPEASFSADPVSGDFPLEVQFDASTSTDDGEIERYAWSFGDGDTAEGVVVVHTYDTPGSYTARISVTDDEGKVGTASVTIEVTDPRQPVTVALQDGVSPMSTYSGTRDSKIKSDAGTANFGSTTNLEVDGSPDYGSLLKWDLTQIPAGAVVTAASVTLTVFNGSGNTYSFYELLRDWQEDEVSWLQYSAGSPWESAGARGSSDVANTILATAPAPQSGTLVLDVNSEGIEVIQGWIEQPTTNRGFLLQNYDGASDGFDFYSREYSTPLERPKLTLTYFPSADAAPAMKNGPVEATSSVSETVGMELPAEFGIQEIYPNPFNPQTNVLLRIPEAITGHVDVFNMIGQRVLTRTFELSPGIHSIPLEMSHCSSGVYIVLARTVKGQLSTSRVTLLK